jgi:hypothetical protein
MDIHNSLSSTDTKQSLFDHYNGFILSSDRHVFNKLITRIEFFHRVRELNGDIVECGVFKGAGMMVWSKLLNLYSPHDIRKVIGFDYFDPGFVSSLETPNDRTMMGQVFSRCDSQPDVSLDKISSMYISAGIHKDKYELIKGDIAVTSLEFVEARPGFRICLLYMDLDLSEPTYSALKILWERVVSGGVVVFDEYAYHVWTESNAVDIFVRERGLKLQKTNVKSPTAFVIKP